MVVLFLLLKELPCCFLKWLHHFSSYQQCIWLLVPPHPCQYFLLFDLLVFFFLDSNHPNGCKVCNPIFNDSVVHWLYCSLLNNQFLLIQEFGFNFFFNFFAFKNNCEIIFVHILECVYIFLNICNLEMKFEMNFEGRRGNEQVERWYEYSRKAQP